MYYKTRLHPRKHSEYIIRNKHVDGCVLHELETKKAPTNAQQCSSTSVCSKSTNNSRMYTSMPTLYQPISMGINQKQKQQQRKQQTMGMVAGSSTCDIRRRRKSMHSNCSVDAPVVASDKLMKSVGGGNKTNQIKSSVDNINATTLTTTFGNNNYRASSTTTIKSNSENQFRFFSNADIYDSAYPADCGMNIINNKIRSIDDCRKDKSRSLTNLNKNSVAYKSNTLRGGGGYGQEDDTSKLHLYSIEGIENELSKIK